MIKGFEAKFDVPILEGYGLSETSPVACFNQRDRPRKAGSIGQPIWRPSRHAYRRSHG